MGVPVFTKAPGEATYIHNTTVDFNGVSAKYVRLTVQTNYGAASKQTGLSEVQFFYVPTKAYEPTPASGSTGIALDRVLNWLGRSQFANDAYFEGALDEFRIYSRSLSEGEIRYLAGDR